MTDPFSERDAARLHELRLRGFLPAPDESAWAELAASGLVIVEHERVRLTPAGTDAHARWARPAAGSDAAQASEAAYTSFLPLNQRLLKVCHDWQVMRGGVPNDHSDPGYDDRVIERLYGVHGSARRILGDLAPRVTRFSGYPSRFDDALAQLASGKREWFASPACDSYHTVWMQFHEDLLLATGRSRADEETQ